jgi:hypothetical protein
MQERPRERARRVKSVLGPPGTRAASVWKTSGDRRLNPPRRTHSSTLTETYQKRAKLSKTK